MNLYIDGNSGRTLLQLKQIARMISEIVEWNEKEKFTIVIKDGK